MSIETIYDFLKKCPNNDFQLAKQNKLGNTCLWIPPTHPDSASYIYESYPSITTHYFIMQREDQLSNIVKCWNVEANSIVPSYAFYLALEAKIIFKEQFYLGLGYSL